MRPRHRRVGTDVVNIGMAGTEEMYWAETEFRACDGIGITSARNPTNYNSMKIVKSHSLPLDSAGDFRVVASNDHYRVSSFRQIQIEKYFTLSNPNE